MEEIFLCWWVLIHLMYILGVWHPSFCTTPVPKSVLSDVECNEFMVCWFLNLKEHHAWNSEGIEMLESPGGLSEKFWTYCKERSWWWRDGRRFMLITIDSHVETLVSVEQLFLHHFLVMLLLLKLMICCFFKSEEQLRGHWDSGV